MSTAQAHAPGLDALSERALSPASQMLLDGLCRSARGSSLWRTRKQMEARELLILAELAPPGRMVIQHLDLAEELRAVYSLRVPAAWRDESKNAVHISDFATLALIYPPEAMVREMHSFPFIQIIAPRPMWHPAVGGFPGLPEVMCLGDTPAGMRCSEIVLTSYCGLAMQNIHLDAFGTMGAMNPAAVAYWQEHLDRLPLSRVPFLQPG